MTEEAEPRLSLDETRSELAARAEKRFDAIPADVVVEHVLRMTETADFAVREAAVQALVRRMSFAARDGLCVVTRPAGRALLGSYGVGRSSPTASAPSRSTPRAPSAPGKRRNGHADVRPYRVELESLEPLQGACDCPDFVRSSLGLCKHLLVVLAELYADPERVARASRTLPRPSATRLVWDPRLPLQGELDRAAGLHLIAEAPRRRDGVPAPLRPFFEAGRLRSEWRKKSASRARALRALEAATRGERATLEATPAARRVVLEELERAARVARCEAERVRTLRELKTLKRRLYPYQREGVDRFLRSGRLLLADDMGLGKTTQAIAICHALFQAERVQRGLLIVPAPLKPQWLREWQETSEVPVALVEGGPEQRRKQYRAHRAGFLIINYERLLRDAPEIHELEPDLVVLDEAQRIKNYATKSAMLVKQLEAEYRLVLTGTPLENRLDELASILDWVDDLALAPKWRLTPWHTHSAGNAAEGESGARNLGTLRTRLQSCTLRRVRSEVVAQLPPRTDTRVPITLTPQQRAAHDELNHPIASLVQRAARRALTQPEFLRLMQLLTQQRIISNGLGQLRFESIWETYSRAAPDPALLEGLFSPKLLELRRLLGELVVDQERKVVVFSQWRRMLRLAEWAVRDVLARSGVRAAFFTGAERPAQRTRSVVDFHDDPRVRVLFLSDAGGVGLNLQKAASACINLEPPWNPAVLEQRIGRIYRLGQTQPIDVYHLICEEGIEARIAGILDAKQALFTGLFDGTTDEIRFDGSNSFLGRMRALVDPTASPGTLPFGRSAAHDPLPDAPSDDDDPDAAEGATDELGGGPGGSPDPDAIPETQRTPFAPAFASLTPAGNSRVAGLDAGSSAHLANLLSTLRVERSATGALHIEAPPETAASLAALFTGMAQLMAAAAGGSTAPNAAEAKTAPGGEP